MAEWAITTFASGDSLPADAESTLAFGELLARAGAIGPSVSFAQRPPASISASFYVEAPSIKDAVVSALEIFLEAAPDAEVAAIEGMTEAEQDRRLAIPVLPRLVGPQEMAGLLQISRQRLYEVMKLPGFPAPVVQLAVGPIWTAESVGNFVQTWRRVPGRRPRELTAVNTRPMTPTRRRQIAATEASHRERLERQ